MCRGKPNSSAAESKQVQLAAYKARSYKSVDIFTFSPDSVLMEIKDALAEELDEMLKNEQCYYYAGVVDEWGAHIN